jgi:hypothetical protein
MDIYNYIKTRSFPLNVTHFLANVIPSNGRENCVITSCCFAFTPTYPPTLSTLRPLHPYTNFTPLTSLHFSVIHSPSLASRLSNWGLHTDATTKPDRSPRNKLPSNMFTQPQTVSPYRQVHTQNICINILLAFHFWYTQKEPSSSNVS